MICHCMRGCTCKAISLLHREAAITRKPFKSADPRPVTSVNFPGEAGETSKGLFVLHGHEMVGVVGSRCHVSDWFFNSSSSLRRPVRSRQQCAVHADIPGWICSVGAAHSNAGRPERPKGLREAQIGKGREGNWKTKETKCETRKNRAVLSAWYRAFPIYDPGLVCWVREGIGYQGRLVPIGIGFCVGLGRVGRISLPYHRRKAGLGCGVIKGGWRMTQRS